MVTSVLQSTNKLWILKVAMGVLFRTLMHFVLRVHTLFHPVIPSCFPFFWNTSPGKAYAPCVGSPGVWVNCTMDVLDTDFECKKQLRVDVCRVYRPLIDLSCITWCITWCGWTPWSCRALRTLTLSLRHHGPS